MDNFSGTTQPILKLDCECTPMDITHDFSFGLRPSELDYDFNTDEIKHIRTICHLASTHPSSSSVRRNLGRIESCSTQTESSATCPSVLSDPSNGASLSVFNRMLELMEKLNNKIDGNTGDLAKLVAEYCDRTRDLERRLQFIENEHEMSRRIPPAAQEPAVPVAVPDPVSAPDPVPVPDPDPVSAPDPVPVPDTDPVSVPDRMPCRYCGKVLSVPYVFKHQKQVHGK